MTSWRATAVSCRWVVLSETAMLVGGEAGWLHPPGQKALAAGEEGRYYSILAGASQFMLSLALTHCIIAALVTDKVRWDSARGFHAPDLLCRECGGQEEVLALIARGVSNRRVGSHELNVESSRRWEWQCMCWQFDVASSKILGIVQQPLPCASMCVPPLQPCHLHCLHRLHTHAAR